MPFIQVIQYRTSRGDDIQELFAKYRDDTEGRRTVEKTTICVDRAAPGQYVAIVEFPSYEAAMENSNLPETEAFAQGLAALSDAPPVFLNLDVSQVHQY
jgi:hypothetical protein